MKKRRSEHRSDRQGERVRIVVREARKGEEEKLADSGFRSFRTADRESWLKYVFRENPHLVAPDTLVAEIGGQIAGQASGFRFTMSLAGRDVPVRGIAAVAVVPEFRRQGVADAVMLALHRQMKRRKEALSMLYPFRMSFYRKFGYGTVEWLEFLRVSPDQLPESPLRRNVRRFDREKDAAALARAYEAARAGTSGRILRSKDWWDVRVLARVGEGVVYVDPGSRRITGYALFDIPADPPYPRQHALVRELVAATPEAFRGILGFFESLGDQYKMLELSFPRGQGLGLEQNFGVIGLPEPLRLFQTAGYASAGAMLRLVDVAAAFALHPGPAANGARGRLGLDLEDPVFPGQTGAFDVTFGASGARVARGRSARDRLALSVATLAQIYGGGTSARVQLGQGMIAGSARAARLLDRAFEGPPVHLLPLNGF
ncbi:MAG: GNAT family N-acetyltransferase [Candidatus Eiseniibacteriota bacterium]